MMWLKLLPFYRSLVHSISRQLQSLITLNCTCNSQAQAQYKIQQPSCFGTRSFVVVVVAPLQQKQKRNRFIQCFSKLLYVLYGSQWYRRSRRCVAVIMKTCIYEDFSFTFSFACNLAFLHSFFFSVLLFVVSVSRFYCLQPRAYPLFISKC